MCGAYTILDLQFFSEVNTLEYGDLLSTWRFLGEMIVSPEPQAQTPFGAWTYPVVFGCQLEDMQLIGRFWGNGWILGDNKGWSGGELLEEMFWNKI